MDSDNVSYELQQAKEEIFHRKQLLEKVGEKMELLKNEMTSLSNHLFKLKIINLQKRKIQLDEKMDSLNTVVEIISDKNQRNDSLKNYLDVLNQKKHPLNHVTLKRGLELEEQTLKNKLNNLSMYFDDKNSKLDEEISNLKLKFTNRQDLVSKVYEKMSDDDKSSIKKLLDENIILEKKLNLLIKLNLK